MQAVSRRYPDEADGRPRITHVLDPESLQKEIPGPSNEGNHGRFPLGDISHRSVPVLSGSGTKGISFDPSSSEGSGKNDG
jgi:hypothetical protein